jgi:hypothetical protein
MIDFRPGVEPYESALMADFFPSGEWMHMLVTQNHMNGEEHTRPASFILLPNPPAISHVNQSSALRRSLTECEDKLAFELLLAWLNGTPT